jgi:hypothetical protein
MEMSNLTVKIIILLIPGLISYFVYKRITKRQAKRSDLMFIAISVLLGTLSYLSLQVINNLCACFDYTELKTFEAISTDNIIPYKEVFWASVLGVIIAYIFTYIDSFNLINNFARLIRASDKVNDENLYSIFLGDTNISWVYVRDIKNSLTYWGWVQSFSEKENGKEIVLKDVTVFSYPNSVRLYDIPSVYLNFGNENIIVEQAI